MFGSLKEILPDQIMKYAVSLKEIGINEFAWNRSNIIEAIKFVVSRNIIILGGDVYKLYCGKLLSTSDSWFYNINSSKDFCFNSFESGKTAISYISNFNDPDNIYLYSIVIKTQ